MEALTDNELMLRVKNGDLDKMALLFKRHHSALFGFLYRMTNQREASEDMLQNVFYRMLKSRHTFIGGSFKTWMYHLARNVCKDYMKKKKREGYHHDLSDFEERIRGGYPSDERIEQKQELEILQNALSKLSAENREVLVLSRFQGMKYHEIAQIMSITEGAVKVRIHRAIDHLKNMYIKIESNEM